MQQNNALRDLSDAAELLVMLEQLIDGIPTEKNEQKRMPLRGMRLTVTQARRCIQRAHESLVAPPARQTADVAPGPAVAQQAEPVTRGAGALAARITKAPTSKGRIRELHGTGGFEGEEKASSMHVVQSAEANRRTEAPLS
ncbi:MAG: hypothetical protein KDD69_05285 [Bdellovibrionales bacterium]|nr:hypothetical protein [Bdellovibrionales bacterium]